MPSDDSSSDCPHLNRRFTGSLYDGPNQRKTFLYYVCPDCGARWSKEERPEEPPLTPEEEEEVWSCANERGCGHLLTNECEYGCRAAADELSREANEMDRRWTKAMGDDEPPPPQPERRPPYAVAYSVQGHLYEVALPGDATVCAVDGGLVISHRLGPVAGIVQVMPVINEESDG